MALVMRAVKSGICEEIGYDEVTGELHMVHENGRKSIHGNSTNRVPADVGQHVESADSVGKAFHQLIRGQYPHRYDP